MPARPLPVTDLPALPRQALGRDIVDLFNAYPEAPGFAIIDKARCPIGYVDKQVFVTKFMSLYGRALYEKRPVETLSSQDYRTVQLDEDLNAIATFEQGAEDISQNTGLIVVKSDGTYLGMTSAFTIMSTLLRENEKLIDNLRAEVQDREAAEHRARTLAETDDLTKLPNRRCFIEHLEAKLEAAEPFMIVYIDLDRFKRINDEAGHAAGDHVLKVIAERLRSFAGSSFCARLGGDEFAMVTPVIDTPEILLKRAKSLEAYLSRVIKSDFGVFRVGASFGTALYPREFSDLETLIDAADKRMLQAKIGPGRRASDQRRIAQLSA